MQSVNNSVAIAKSCENWNSPYFLKALVSDNRLLPSLSRTTGSDAVNRFRTYPSCPNFVAGGLREDELRSLGRGGALVDRGRAGFCSREGPVEEDCAEGEQGAVPVAEMPPVEGEAVEEEEHGEEQLAGRASSGRGGASAGSRQAGRRARASARLSELPREDESSSSTPTARRGGPDSSAGLIGSSLDTFFFRSTSSATPLPRILTGSIIRKSTNVFVSSSTLL